MIQSMPEDRLRVAVLGDVRAYAGDRPVALGRTSARVLAVLAASPRRVVTVASLIDALWGEAPPASAEGAVHSYVSRLRKALVEAGLDGPRTLVTRSGGYALVISAGAVDVAAF